MHHISNVLAGARGLLFGNTEISLQQYLACNDSAMVREHLINKKALSLDEFSQICFHMPCLAQIAIDQYPEHVKNAPFSLLLSLAKVRTHQDAAYHVRPCDFDPTPTTEDVLIALVQAGAPIGGKEPLTDYTLLHHAVENGLARAANVLLDHGVDQTATLRSGITALHMAARNGYTFEKVITTLAQNTLLLNAQTTTKATPLHYAAKENSHRAVELLLEAGAKRDIKDMKDLTPLDITKTVDKQYFTLSLLSRSRAGYALTKGNISETIALLQAGDTISDDDAATSCIGNHTYGLERLLKDYPEAAKFFTGQLIVRLLNHWASPECIAICLNLIQLGVACNERLAGTDKTALHIALEKLERTRNATRPDPVKEQALLFELLEELLSKASPEEFNSHFFLDETHYKNDELLKMPPEPTFAADILCLAADNSEAKTFINKVTKEEPFLGTPKAGTQALKDFYKTIRNCLAFVAVEMRSRTQDAQNTMLKEVAQKLASASGECGVQYLETALDLYNTYVTKITPSMSSALLEQLQALRGVLVETMTEEPYVNKEQTVHALRYIKKTIGKDLGLRDYKAHLQDDVLASSGFTLFTPPSSYGLHAIFKKRYTPFVIYEYVASLMSDIRYRNFYIDWAKKALKTSIPGNDGYRREKSKLQAHLIDYYGARNPEIVAQIAALKENRRAEVLTWLFHENSFKPKIVPIILSLIQLKTIKIKSLQLYSVL